MKNTVVIAAIAAIACFIAPAASAATILDNTINGSGGSCAFATTCGASVGADNPFVGQIFTVSGPTRLTSGGLTAYLRDSTTPFSINWKILSVGTDGLPGMSIAAGSSAITSQTYIGEQFGLSIAQNGFDLAGTTLSGGSYYFALQAVTQAFDVYLATADGIGAAYSSDGTNWVPGYDDASAVAVSLSGEPLAAVPETSTWAMMIVGFGLAGASVRRRRTNGRMRMHSAG